MVRAPSRERYPVAALAKALTGRTAVDASCDGEGMDDVRVLLDDGTAILVHVELDTDPESVALAEALGRPPWPRLLVCIGDRRQLWPFDDD
jgi:hypothetical protein